MSERTIVAVDTMNDMFVGKIVRASVSIANPRLEQLALDPDKFPPLHEDNAVLKRGQMLRDALRGHQDICGVLDALSRSVDPHPLFVQLGPTDAEALNWEMLCDMKDAFIALDQRWPIARVVDTVNARSRPLSEMGASVRMLAVISAIGIKDQSKEWEWLRDSVVQANASGEWIKLKVLVGHPDLYAAIEKEIQAGLDVELGSIEASAPFLTQAIVRWRPNILHFFCHGHADAVGQSLELATAVDHRRFKAGEADTGSVRIDVQTLAQLAGALQNAWLLVLNCCSAGKPVPGLQSMANQAVTAGFPCAVAMLEPVAATDAYDFTRAFYPDAFAALAQVREDLRAKASTSLEWTPVMHNVRVVISHGKEAADSPEWSLPVLYVRGLEAQRFIGQQVAAIPSVPPSTPTPTPAPTPPQPVPTPTPTPTPEAAQQLSDKFRVQVEAMAAWLTTAGQQLTVEQRVEVMEFALTDVPKALWPNPEGQFDGNDG